MKLGLVIDLDACVGCHACATACRNWNNKENNKKTGQVTDTDINGSSPSGNWFNRIRHYESGEFPQCETTNVPMSCLHCENPACVDVCPTGASYKREEDGIVLVDQDKCMGCNLCAWACPYGARELNPHSGTMTKCTLCVDRIYDDNLKEEERQPACVLSCPTNARHFGDFDDPDSEVSQLTKLRGGYDLMPELGYQPTNKYLPPRAKNNVPTYPVDKSSLKTVVKKWVNKLIAR